MSKYSTMSSQTQASYKTNQNLERLTKLSDRLNKIHVIIKISLFYPRSTSNQINTLNTKKSKSESTTSKKNQLKQMKRISKHFRNLKNKSQE